jgi:CheY-like chemotaxis protein
MIPLRVRDMNDRKSTILIVDDEPLTLKVIASFLSGKEYNLLTATGGRKALEIMLKDPENIDVVLLDLRMPDLDGIEVLKQIKQHPVLKELPVIIQTGAKSEEDVISGLEAGAYYYLTKPYTERVLSPIIRTAVEDRTRCLNLQEQLEQSVQVLGLMKSGEFCFQSIDEAENLAVFLSNACPQPVRIVTGLSEILINAVEHGNLGIGYAEKTRLIQNDEWASEIQRRLELSENLGKYVHLEFKNLDSVIKI